MPFGRFCGCTISCAVHTFILFLSWEKFCCRTILFAAELQLLRSHFLTANCTLTRLHTWYYCSFSDLFESCQCEKLLQPHNFGVWTVLLQTALRLQVSFCECMCIFAGRTFFCGRRITLWTTLLSAILLLAFLSWNTHFELDFFVKLQSSNMPAI